ncbi:MAG: hypothetical protein ACFFDN_00240 [Candidatus Hodarchaeota archaeon]
MGPFLSSWNGYSDYYNFEIMEIEDFIDILIPKRLRTINRGCGELNWQKPLYHYIKKIPSKYKKTIPLIYIGRMGSGSHNTFRFVVGLISHFYSQKLEIIQLDTILEENPELQFNDLKEIISYSTIPIKIIYTPKNTLKDILPLVLKIVSEIEGLKFLFISASRIEKEFETRLLSSNEEIYKDYYLSIPEQLKKSAKLLFLKSYYENIDKYFTINEEEIKFLKEMTYEVQIKQNFKAKMYGLCITSKKEVKRIAIPYIEKKV